MIPVLTLKSATLCQGILSHFSSFVVLVLLKDFLKRSVLIKTNENILTKSSQNLHLESVQIASHKIIFVFMQKFSMFLNSNKLYLVLSVTTRHRAF